MSVLIQLRITNTCGASLIVMVIKILLTTMKNNHNSRSSIFSRMRNLRTQSSQSMMGHNHCQMMMNVNLSLRVQHHHRRHEQHTSASGYIGNTAGESGTQPHHRSFSLSSLSSIVAQQGPRKSIEPQTPLPDGIHISQSKHLYCRAWTCRSRKDIQNRR